MNLTAVSITFIICTTILLICFYGGKDKGDNDE